LKRGCLAYLHVIQLIVRMAIAGGQYSLQRCRQCMLGNSCPTLCCAVPCPVLCCAVQVSVRKAALVALSTLLDLFPAEPSLCTAWVASALPLVRDVEPSIQVSHPNWQIAPLWCSMSASHYRVQFVCYIVGALRGAGRVTFFRSCGYMAGGGVTQTGVTWRDAGRAAGWLCNFPQLTDRAWDPERGSVERGRGNIGVWQ
jgi:hypothetical protein